jgi:hypothetical protein
MAAGPSAATRPIVKTVNAKIFDIALSNGGTFKGRVVDHAGVPMEGAEVVIKQNSKEIGRSLTDKTGTFTASNLNSGVYSVASGNTEGTYRMWAENTAPPSAKEQGLLVMGENGARGNFGYGDDGAWVLAVGAVAVAALTVGIVALVRANQANNKQLPASP